MQRFTWLGYLRLFHFFLFRAHPSKTRRETSTGYRARWQLMATFSPLLGQPLPRASAHCTGAAAATKTKAPPPPRRLVAAAKLTARRGFVGVVRCSSSVDGVEAPPRSVPVRVAYELQQAGHRYLDVRTQEEFSAGHPQGALNIPYMHRTGSGMTKNTHFLDQVSTVFGKDDEIIVGCQSGKRSLMAATELSAAGFTAVTDIAGGFSSWRENGLPLNQ